MNSMKAKSRKLRQKHATQEPRVPLRTLTHLKMPIRVHVVERKSGINPTPEFVLKGLADYSVNPAVKCDHACAYCSSGSTLRRLQAFKDTGENPFEHGFAIVDPDMPARIRKDAQRLRNSKGTVQLCTLVDAWSPVAQEYDLGRQCLAAILEESSMQVRCLTKNAAITKDFDLISKYKDRVLVGLSLTGTPDKSSVISVLEPNASPVEERIAAMQEAHRRGLRTYGMLCPLMPGIADAPNQVDELVKTAIGFGAEEIFAEAVNPRGRGLLLCVDWLQKAGFTTEAHEIDQIRHMQHRSPYMANLIANVQQSVRRHGDIKDLRFLLYSKGMAPADLTRVRRDKAGIIWLS